MTIFQEAGGKDNSAQPQLQADPSKEKTFAPRPANTRACDDNFEQKCEKTCRPSEKSLPQEYNDKEARTPKDYKISVYCFGPSLAG